MFEPHTTESELELTHLHASTCRLMTRFINGHHCPKLSHLIVQNLGDLLAHPESKQIPTNRNMYQQLMEHWQNVTNFLLEQKAVRRAAIQRH